MINRVTRVTDKPQKLTSKWIYSKIKKNEKSELELSLNKERPKIRGKKIFFSSIYFALTQSAALNELV